LIFNLANSYKATIILIYKYRKQHRKSQKKYINILICEIIICINSCLRILQIANLFIGKHIRLLRTKSYKHFTYISFDDQLFLLNTGNRQFNYFV